MFGLIKTAIGKEIYFHFFMIMLSKNKLEIAPSVQLQQIVQKMEQKALLLGLKESKIIKQSQKLNLFK